MAIQKTHLTLTATIVGASREAVPLAQLRGKLTPRQGTWVPGFRFDHQLRNRTCLVHRKCRIHWRGRDKWRRAEGSRHFEGQTGRGVLTDAALGLPGDGLRPGALFGWVEEAQRAVGPGRQGLRRPSASGQRARREPTRKPQARDGPPPAASQTGFRGMENVVCPEPDWPLLYETHTVSRPTATP